MRRGRLVGLFLGSSLFFSLSPAVYYWDGEAGNNNFSTAANWNPNGNPGNTDTVILDHTYVSSSYTVQLTGGEQVCNVLINGNITLDLQGNTLQVNGNFTQQGSSQIIDTGGGGLIQLRGGCGGPNYAITQDYPNAYIDAEVEINGAATDTFSLLSSFQAKDFTLTNGILTSSTPYVLDIKRDLNFDGGTIQGEIDIYVGNDLIRGGGTYNVSSQRVISLTGSFDGSSSIEGTWDNTNGRVRRLLVGKDSTTVNIEDSVDIEGSLEIVGSGTISLINNGDGYIDIYNTPSSFSDSFIIVGSSSYTPTFNISSPQGIRVYPSDPTRNYKIAALDYGSMELIIEDDGGTPDVGKKSLVSIVGGNLQVGSLTIKERLDVRGNTLSVIDLSIETPDGEIWNSVNGGNIYVRNFRIASGTGPNINNFSSPTSVYIRGFLQDNRIMASTIDFSNATVYFDGGGDQQISISSPSGAKLIVGSLYFQNPSSSQKTLTIEASYLLEVLNNFSARGGGTSSLLRLVSSNPGTSWNLQVSSSASFSPSLDFLYVQDSNASLGISIPAGSNSIDGGNNQNWIFPNTYYFASSGNWGNLSLWKLGGCGGVLGPSSLPTKDTNVVICPGVSATLSSNAQARNVLVETSSTLNLGNFILEVAGSFTLQGSLLGGISSSLSFVDGSSSPSDRYLYFGSALPRISFRFFSSFAKWYLTSSMIPSAGDFIESFTLSSGVFYTQGYNIGDVSTFRIDGGEFYLEGGQITTRDFLISPGGKFFHGGGPLFLKDIGNSIGSIQTAGNPLFRIGVSATNSTSLWDVLDSLVIENDLSIQEGVFRSNSFLLEIKGRMIIGDGVGNATLNATGSSMYVGTDWIEQSDAQLIPPTFVEFTGVNDSSSNAYSILQNAGNRFKEVRINSPDKDAWNLGSNVSMDFLRIQSGSLGVAGKTLSTKRIKIEGGTLIGGTASTIEVEEVFSYTSGSFLPGTSQVKFLNNNGSPETFTWQVGGICFYDFIIQSFDGDTVGLDGDLCILNMLQVADGSLTTNDFSITTKNLQLGDGGGISGSISALTSTIRVEGNLTLLLDGSFQEGTSTVVLDNSGGASQVIKGSWNFYHLTLGGSSNRTITFPAGLTQVVKGVFRAGKIGPGVQLALRSSSVGNQFTIDFQGSKGSPLEDLDIQDGKAISSNSAVSLPIDPGDASYDRGNNVGWFSPLQVISRETQDANQNGKIDRIKLVFSRYINNDCSAVNVSVSGYTVTGYGSCAGEMDNFIYVLLQENPGSCTLGNYTGCDTNATPSVQITSNTSLGDGSTKPTDSSPVSSLDRAGPALLGGYTRDKNNNGKVDTLDLYFSEGISTLDFSSSNIYISSPGGYSTLNEGGSLSSNAFSIKIKENNAPCDVYSQGGCDTSITPLVGIGTSSSIKDALGNSIVGNATLQDGAPPSLIGAKAQIGGNNLVAIFSENISVGSLSLSSFYYKDLSRKGASGVINILSTGSNSISFLLDRPFSSRDHKIDIFGILGGVVQDSSGNPNQEKEVFTIDPSAGDFPWVEVPVDSALIETNYIDIREKTRVAVGVNLSQGGEVEISLYDIRGKKVTTLIREYVTPGEHFLYWDLKDHPSLRPGLYYIVVETNYWKKKVFYKIIVMK